MEHAHEAAVWTMPDSSLAAGLAGAATCGLAMGHERTTRSVAIGQWASNSVPVWDLRGFSRPLLPPPCGAGMAAGEPMRFQPDCTRGHGLGTGQEGMRHSDRLRRGQRLLQDGAITREQQRSLIEEARAARRGEQIARPQEHAGITARLPSQMSQQSHFKIVRKS
jgi:hypothetical protein